MYTSAKRGDILSAFQEVGFVCGSCGRPNPTRPKPPVLPGPNIACTEYLLVHERGMIYVTNNNDGMYILTVISD